MPALACFITAHGYGHATRSAAVLAALRQRLPQLVLHVFTEVPEALLRTSIPGDLHIHRCWTDVGLVQSGPFAVDIAATVAELDAHLPFPDAQINALAATLRHLAIDAVLGDISALAVAVAHAAGVPAILLENFTWDWIYAGYQHADLQRHAAYLRQWWQQADLHLQTAPLCQPQPGVTALPPISRRPRLTRQQVRQRLGVSEEQALVLLTLGGIPWTEDAPWPQPPAGITVLVPAADDDQQGGIRCLRDSDWFHPDLLHAVDGVVAKVGYSTVAEAWLADVPLAYIERPGFRESAVVAAFIAAQLPSLALTTAALSNGNWAARLPELLALPRQHRQRANGDAPAAAAICAFLGWP